MQTDIAIIGAGFSGCNLYNNLKEKYENITIFEKSRGVGGRLSTKYIEDKLQRKLFLTERNIYLLFQL